MTDDARDVPFVGDADDLLNGRDEAGSVVALVADVARVDAAALARDSCECDHLFRLREAAGRVEQPAREPERAVVHGAPHEPAHPVQLLGGRLGTRRRLHHGAAHAAVADEERDVRPEPAGLERLALRRQIGRPAAIRIHDERRHALRNDRLCLAQVGPRQSFGRMRVDIDESGGDETLGGVDRRRRLGAGERAHRGDAAGGLTRGEAVNVEPALCAGEPLGGHIVQGHVDGLGNVRGAEPEGDGVRLTISAPPEILRYCVEKGSITVEGVSLTVAALGEGAFQIALIPHTLEVTTLGALSGGDEVNLEVDVIAKYVEALLPKP